VQFKVDGTNIGSAITSSPYTTTWNSTGVADGSHTLTATACDAAANCTAASIIVTVHNGPTISSISSTATNLTIATTTWTTDKAATSQIEYGLTTAYGATTTLDATLVTSHSVVLSGLAANTRYHYRIRTTDGQGNLATSTDQTFITAYIGVVATKGLLNIYLSSPNKQIMTRSIHLAQDNISSLQLVFHNFNIVGSPLAEAGLGSTTAITASIEYPTGTFTQVKFSGTATGTIPDGGILVSDSVAANIPIGTYFNVRDWLSNGAGILYRSGLNGPGEVAAFAPSGVPDMTMGGTITSSGGQVGYFPAAIVGLTQRPSVYLLGDSRVFGQNDPPNDATGDAGELARSIGPSFGYINDGLPSDKITSFLASHTNRRALAAYTSDIISELGINDLLGSVTASTTLSNLQSLWALFPGKKIFQTTLPPITTSTDSWATLVNQTVASWNSQRTSLNNAIRAVPSGANGYFEVANVVESSQDSGKWQVDGTANKYTSDGIHESPFANQAIHNSGNIATTSITR
jgi:hypothetical protein